MKILAKILNENSKLLENELFEFDGEFDSEKLYNYMQEICYKFKIETPIILNKHKNGLYEFNSTKFMKEDFIDTIDFKSLLIELVKE